jgi:hypothetical protein
MKAPQNRAELDALVAQRDVIQNQLRDMEARRTELASRSGTNQQEINRRIQALDARIDATEAQLVEADRLIRNAVGNPAISGEQTSTAPVTGPVGGVLVPAANPVDVNSLISRTLVVEVATLLLLGAIGWVFAVRRLERRFRTMFAANPSTTSQLQQSVDAIAIEVERISENQRFVTKLLNDRGLGAGEAQHIPARRDT